MRDLVETIAAWRAEGVAIGRAVVVRTFGSAPRPEGAALLLASDGRIAGSVSGGCVEGAAVEEIRRSRAESRSRVIRYGISDEQAWDVGLACGGTIDVLVEPRLRPEVEEAASGSNAPRAVVTPLPADSPGPRLGPHVPGAGASPAPVLVAFEDGRLEGSLGDPALDRALLAEAQDALLRGASRTVVLGDRSLFIEAFPRRPRIVIVGAVQLAIPLVAIARALGYETVVVDGRPAFATRQRFPDADRVIVGWLDDVADQIALGPADAVAVLSHDMKFDEPAILTALACGCRYVGAVGSRRTQADRRERLRGAGASEADLARLRGPIGLDLGGRAPGETALSVMAEVVAERYGGTGRPMVERAVERSSGGRTEG